MKVKAHTERNFRRARAKPGRRKATRRRLTWRALVGGAGMAVLTACGAYYGADLMRNARVFKVTRITVEGNVRLTGGEVEQLAHGLYGANLLTADLAACRRALMTSPWVADAAMRRVLPSTVEIVLSERRPVGVSRLGSQLYLIDRRGFVIDEFGPQYAEFDLPIIDGLGRPPRDGRAAPDPDRTALAVRVIDELAEAPALAARVSQIDVSDVRNAVVLLDDDPAQLRLGTERFRHRLQSWFDVAARLREQVPDIEYVDLRYEQHVYVQPRGRAAGTRLASPARMF